MKRQDLSKQQTRVYQRLLADWQRHGRLPELAELARELKLHYTTLRQHLQALDAKGYLRFESRGAGRAPRLELQGVAAGVPIVGDIPAGPLSEAVAQADGYLTLPGGEGLFALEVQGDSMADLIQDGDLVLLAKTRPRRSGEICALRVDESEVTLKYLDWSPAEPEHRILRPHNPAYPTVQLDARSLVVEGVYRGLIRGSLIQKLLRQD